MSPAGLIIIVFGTIILVLIVDTSEQLTTAIGILGAIAGYLFRSAQENNQEQNQKPLGVVHNELRFNSRRPLSATFQDSSS